MKKLNNSANFIFFWNLLKSPKTIFLSYLEFCQKDSPQTRPLRYGWTPM